MSTNRYCQAGRLPLVAAMLAAAAICGCKSESTPLPNASSPRVVTYSPALTQMVVDLGLGSHLVGVTSQCTVPPELHPRVVGDAFHVGVEAILSSRPDVVLVQIDPARFDPLRRVAPNVRVEPFTIERLWDIPPALERIGRICGREDAAEAALEKWRANLKAAEMLAAGGSTAPSASTAATLAARRPLRVLFVMGYQQPSTGGAGTFLSDMIERSGGVNAAADLKGWSQVSVEYALGARPDVLVCLLDSETQKSQGAQDYWQPVLRSGARWVVLTDRKWTIPGLHTAGYVLRLAEVLYGGAKALGAGPGLSGSAATAPREGAAP